MHLSRCPKQLHSRIWDRSRSLTSSTHFQKRRNQVKIRPQFQSSFFRSLRFPQHFFCFLHRLWLFCIDGLSCLYRMIGCKELRSVWMITINCYMSSSFCLIAQGQQPPTTHLKFSWKKPKKGAELYSTVLYCVFYCTILFCTILYLIVIYCIYIVMHRTEVYCTVL